MEDFQNWTIQKFGPLKLKAVTEEKLTLPNTPNFKTILYVKESSDQTNEKLIFRNGLDISKISVHYLRYKLAIIPQQPILFSASLRYNIDPFDLSSDDAIWDALRAVNLEAYVNSSLPSKLKEFSVRRKMNHFHI